MTFEEAIQVYKDWVKRDSEMEFADRLENIELYNMAIQALEQIKQIKEIINAPVYIQENVFRYQMICEVIRDDKA